MPSPQTLVNPRPQPQRPANPVLLYVQRFRDLALDRRSWLLVSHGAGAEAERGSGGTTYRRSLPTLREAVAASRPGDTILLEAGAPHHAHNIILPWPLRIMGGGAGPADTALVGPASPDPMLDFRASGRLTNLTVRPPAAASTRELTADL